MISRFVVVSILVSAFFSGASWTAHAQPGKSPSGESAPLIRVFITSSAAEADLASGFKAAPDKRTSNIVKNLTEQIQKHKHPMKGGVLSVVSERSSADVVLVYETDYTTPLGESWMTTIKATLIVGDLQRPIELKAGGLEQALKRLGENVELFAQENREKLRP